MTVDLYNGLRQSGKFEATQTIIRNVFGEPVLVIEEPQPGTLIVHQADDPGFEEALSRLGLAGGIRVRRDKLSRITPPRIAI